jgi:predicted nicotinamide N-methyase
MTDTNTRTVHGITLLTSQHKDIRRLKRQFKQPSIHGNKFWGSSYLLMDYLQQNPLAEGAKVLELGCGWGALSIFCAKQFNAQVTALDADPAVFPYLDLHAAHNGVTVNHACRYFEDLTEQHLAEIDVLIGADICFWDELTDTLLDTIERAINAGVKTILLSDPEREPFFALAESCIEQYYADLIPYSVDHPRRSSGCLLIIENA